LSSDLIYWLELKPCRELLSDWPKCYQADGWKII